MVSTSDINIGMGRWWINHAAALLLVSGAHGYGEVVVDQSFEPDGSVAAGGPDVHVQTFTVGLTGILRHIDAPIVVPATGFIYWEVRATTNGVPSDQILAWGSLPGYLRVFTNSYFEWVRFSLPEPGIAIATGDVLALALRTSGPSMSWWSGSARGSGDPYGRGVPFLLRPGGTLREDASADLGFRTLVEVQSLPPGYPRMSGPERVGGQWQFSLIGDSNHVYIFERSQDVQTWTPVLTNALRTESRTFMVADSPAAEFYRARVGKRANTFALVVMQNIENNSGTLTTDSFDSSDPRFSTNGRYDPSKRKAGGDLGLCGSLSSTSRVIQIYGRTWLSRNTTNFAPGPLSSVGDLAWHGARNSGIQPAWLRTDLDGVYPTPRVPSGPWVVPAPGVVNGESYQYVLTDGFFKLAALSLNGTDKMLVTGRAVLWVTDNLGLAGQARIQLQSADTHLTIYGGGFSTVFGGQGIVGAVLPENFIYYGLNSNWQLTIQCSPFVGVIYAPGTDCSIQRQSLTEIMGSCVVSTLEPYGPLTIHLDESLQKMVLY